MPWALLGVLHGCAPGTAERVSPAARPCPPRGRPGPGSCGGRKPPPLAPGPGTRLTPAGPPGPCRPLARVPPRPVGSLLPPRDPPAPPCWRVPAASGGRSGPRRAGKFGGAGGERPWRRHVRQRAQLQRAGGRGGARAGAGGSAHHDTFGSRGLRALQQRHQEVRGAARPSGPLGAVGRRRGGQCGAGDPSPGAVREECGLGSPLGKGQLRGPCRGTVPRFAASTHW